MNCPTPANASVLGVQADRVLATRSDTSAAAGGTMSLAPHMEDRTPEEQASALRPVKKKQVHKRSSEYTQLSAPSETCAHTQ